MLDSVKENVGNINMVRHMLATEAIMRALARHLGEDEGEWGLAGLIHDIDVELTQGDMTNHSKLGADLARELGASEAMAHAVLCHNERHGIACETNLDKALFCVDPLTGLITAAALVRPYPEPRKRSAAIRRARFEHRERQSQVQIQMLSSRPLPLLSVRYSKMAGNKRYAEGSQPAESLRSKGPGHPLLDRRPPVNP